jgi:hypothetical protein
MSPTTYYRMDVEVSGRCDVGSVRLKVGEVRFARLVSLYPENKYQ